MVNIYYMSVHGSTYALAKHFTLKEMQCKDGQDFVPIDSRLMELLENIRVRAGDPVHINSGYRTASYNRTLKNASPRSQHCFGTAADIWVGYYRNNKPVLTKTPAEVAAIAEDYLGNSGGIGIYSNFTHVDVREKGARWKGTY